MWLSFVSGRLLHRCQWALTLPHQFSLLHNGRPAHQEYSHNVILLLLYVARCVTHSIIIEMHIITTVTWTNFFFNFVFEVNSWNVRRHVWHQWQMGKGGLKLTLVDWVYVSIHIHVFAHAHTHIQTIHKLFVAKQYLVVDLQGTFLYSMWYHCKNVKKCLRLSYCHWRILMYT